MLRLTTNHSCGVRSKCAMMTQQPLHRASKSFLLMAHARWDPAIPNCTPSSLNRRPGVWHPTEKRALVPCPTESCHKFPVGVLRGLPGTDYSKPEPRSAGCSFILSPGLLAAPAYQTPRLSCPPAYRYFWMFVFVANHAEIAGDLQNGVVRGSAEQKQKQNRKHKHPHDRHGLSVQFNAGLPFWEPDAR